MMIDLLPELTCMEEKKDRLVLGDTHNDKSE
jgi:hypothetical protein